MGKNECNERGKECEFRRERERDEKLLGRKMESRKEIKRKKVLRKRFRESERDLRREGRRL